MSYVTMDHAAWAQENLAIGKQMELAKRTRKPRENLRTGYLGAPDKLSDFHATAFNILGMVGGGIYNAPIVWDRIGWGYGLEVPWRGGFATFDYDRMTRLVLLCHEARIRCDVSPRTFRYLTLIFHERGDTSRFRNRHPNVAEAVASFRAYLPADHSIIYREPAPAEAEVAA